MNEYHFTLIKKIEVDLHNIIISSIIIKLFFTKIDKGSLFRLLLGGHIRQAHKCQKLVRMFFMRC